MAMEPPFTLSQEVQEFREAVTVIAEIRERRARILQPLEIGDEAAASYREDEVLYANHPSSRFHAAASVSCFSELRNHRATRTSVDE